ncbi:MAG: hypothetical protein LBT08_09995 [Synergistaceae bacterium]|nr:hypothetical protein [Synergistaceae bacterium]
MPNEISEIHYTICPVGNASYIAANKGWFKEGLRPLGVEPVLLPSLPREYWKAHFDYSDPVLFREGGNIPPIWAKSNGADVVLIGTALLAQRQYIIVRADSTIGSVDELIHCKLGIPVRSKALIDFHKATAEHGFSIALESRGFRLADENRVEIITEGDFHSTPINQKGDYKSREFYALESGEVDALYVKLSTIQQFLDTGKFRVLFDLTSGKEHILPINNEYPEAFTVSRSLAEKRPEVVVAYVKQVLRAARWAKTNYPGALACLAAQTHATRIQAAASFAFDFHRHLDLNLSEENLSFLDAQKRFLYDSGYITKDFDISAWADGSFLRAADAELLEEDAA